MKPWNWFLQIQLSVCSTPLRTKSLRNGRSLICSGCTISTISTGYLIDFQFRDNGDNYFVSIDGMDWHSHRHWKIKCNGHLTMWLFYFHPGLLEVAFFFLMESRIPPFFNILFTRVRPCLGFELLFSLRR